MKNIENNKLIADFMGVEKENGLYLFTTSMDDYKTDTLYFDTSWDWLMPVVEKIEGIGVKDGNSTDYYDVWIMPDCVRIGLQSNEKEPLIIVNKSEVVGSINHEVHSFEDKKKATYQAVVEFIKWNNENK